MSVGLRLDLRQKQTLVMTPQLQQAIKLLQMTNLELRDYIEREVESNPVLENGSGAEEARDAASDGLRGPLDRADEPGTSSAPSADRASAADRETESHERIAETFDTGHENLHDPSPSDGPSPYLQSAAHGPGGSASTIDIGRILEERHAARPGLKDHLRAQVGSMSASPPLPAIARYLIEDLDEHGYLRTDLADIAERLDVDRSLVEQSLRMLQQCEPTGVGARSVSECLALQLRERDRLDPAMAVLVDNLDLLARGELARIARLSGQSIDEVRDMIAEIRALDPRPCSGFDASEPETLIPDILLRPTSWGGWTIELNPETLPRVLIDQEYISEFSSRDCGQTRQFLSDCQASANWLVRSLDQRAKTIVRVASEIVRQQEAFFTHGIAGLRPLTLREVADAVGVHKSTASRVTTNKYIATERGIFELRFFFSNGVGGEGGPSAEAVRHRIKTIIDTESDKPDRVLSDDAIVQTLSREGIDIARRTVAKYRKSLGIASSSARRRQYALRTEHGPAGAGVD